MFDHDDAEWEYQKAIGALLGSIYGQALAIGRTQQEAQMLGHVSIEKAIVECPHIADVLREVERQVIEKLPEIEKQLRAVIDAAKEPS